MEQNRCAVARVGVAVCVALLACVQARAQSFDSIGVRAKGMGGAFVAVADDATASWWNPAGLAGGPYFNALLEPLVGEQSRSDVSGSKPVGVAVGFPALALSYYRVPFTGTRAVSSASPRDLSLFGATVGQSLGDHVVVASTLKLVRALEQTRGDLDLGVMASWGPVRAGLSLKNLTRPGFADGAGEVAVPRQARAGVAFLAGPLGRPAVTVAVDADLTSTPTPLGDERRVATGVEVWVPGRRLAVRGGVSANTLDDAHLSGSVGASLAVRTSVFADFKVRVRLTI